MRHFSYLNTLSLIVAAALTTGLAAAAASAQPAPETSVSSSPLKTDDALDSLFADLKRESDEARAKRISKRIWARWNDSGSATVNLLMQWAEKAIADRKNGLAMDLLDQATVLQPDFAEAWNRRAALHYLMGSHGKSMTDINRALRLEPRHFGAIAGMAAILSDAGNDELELRAWEQMLEIYPANRQAQKKVEELADKLAGSRT